MKMLRYLAAAAATAGVAGVAAPALAQTYSPYAYPQQAYPQYQYPQQYPQAYPQYQTPQQYPQAYPQTGYAYPGQQGYAQNPVGALINQLLGNRYNVTDRTAITQCAAAAQAQAAAQYRPTGYGQGYPGYQGYQGYNNAYGSARVTGITNVERRQNGLRVSGLMSSGMTTGYGGYGGYGGYAGQGYNPAYANTANDLTFRCNVDYRGAVTNVRVRRNNAYRG